MYIFAILSPWLLLGALLNSEKQDKLLSFLKGIVSGLYWFIPWMIFRIILPQIFTLELTAEGIFYRYLLIHLVIPFMFLILSSRTKSNNHSSRYIFGKCVSFYIFSGYLNIFLFPLHGPYTRFFLIPISTGLLIIGLSILLHFFFSLDGSFTSETSMREYLKKYRVQCVQAMFLCIQMVALFLLIAYFLVLDFQRLPNQLLLWIIGSIGIIFSMHQSRWLVEQLNGKILIPFWDKGCKPKIQDSFSKVFGNFL